MSHHPVVRVNPPAPAWPLESAMLRSLFIGLSESKRLRHFAEQSPLGLRFSSRFVAGTQLDDVIRATQVVNEWGASVSIDNLGENVTNADEAKHSAELYHRMLDEISSAQAERQHQPQAHAHGLRRERGAGVRSGDRTGGPRGAHQQLRARRHGGLALHPAHARLRPPTASRCPDTRAGSAPSSSRTCIAARRM